MKLILSSLLPLIVVAQATTVIPCGGLDPRVTTHDLNVLMRDAVIDSLKDSEKPFPIEIDDIPLQSVNVQFIDNKIWIGEDHIIEESSSLNNNHLTAIVEVYQLNVTIEGVIVVTGEGNEQKGSYSLNYRQYQTKSLKADFDDKSVKITHLDENMKNDGYRLEITGITVAGMTNAELEYHVGVELSSWIWKEEKIARQNFQKLKDHYNAMMAGHNLKEEYDYLRNLIPRFDNWN